MQIKFKDGQLMKKEVDLYDFDKTIVPFDSGSLFVAYCMLHYPWCIITLPVMAVAALLMLVGIISFTDFKKTCFMFLPLIPCQRAVKSFWDKYEGRVHSWFADKPRYAIVISASPDFLLNEIKGRFGIDTLICTRHNAKSGIIIGENCRGEEKVRRLFQEFDKNEIKIMDVYSDSIKHDKYIFALANENCYHIVKGERVKINIKELIGA